MLCERWGSGTVCQIANAQYRTPSDFIVLPSVVAGLRVNVIDPQRMLEFWGETTDAQLDKRYHQGGFTVIYCDGHAKWNKRSMTFHTTAQGLVALATTALRRFDETPQTDRAAVPRRTTKRKARRIVVWTI